MEQLLLIYVTFSLLIKGLKYFSSKNAPLRFLDYAAVLYIIFGWTVCLEWSFLQAMSRASDEGLIFIEGTGPTYATQTVMIYAHSLLFFSPNAFLVGRLLSTVFCALLFHRCTCQSLVSSYIIKSSISSFLPFICWSMGLDWLVTALISFVSNQVKPQKALYKME